MEMNAAGLAEVFGVDRRTVGNWLNATPPCPSTIRARVRVFNLAEVVRWKDRRTEEAMRRALEPQDLEEARTRKMAAEARLAEIEVALAEGRAVLVEDSVRVVDKLLGQLRAQLLNFSQRWAPRLVGVKTIPEAAALLDDGVRELMVLLRGEAE